LERFIPEHAANRLTKRTVHVKFKTIAYFQKGMEPFQKKYKIFKQD
jgi:hypothetical protein